MQDIWNSWTIYPDIVIGLLLLLGIYLLLSGPLKKNFTFKSVEPKPGQIFLFISGIILFFEFQTLQFLRRKVCQTSVVNILQNKNPNSS